MNIVHVFEMIVVRRVLLLLTILLGAPLIAMASSTQISEVPTNWRLENYPAGPVTIWFSSSTCTSGSLSLPANATASDINRFWSLILSAKLSGHKVFVYYENASAPTSCPIISFGMDG